MGLSEHKSTLKSITSTLAEALEISREDLQVESENSGGRTDAVVRFGKHVFVCEIRKAAGSAVVLSSALQLVKYAPTQGRTAIPLLIVPFMGDSGKRICAEHSVSWLDLSGNANISAKGLRLRIEGRPNQYKRPGRPSSVFAPKSSRIVRWLLAHPDIDEGQLSLRSFAASADVDPGLTSRILKRLVEAGYITRDTSKGSIRVLDRSRLLDDWQTSYDFQKHQIIEGHIAARSGEDLLFSIDAALQKEEINHAATGLGAAWLYTRFASFRTVTFYVDEIPANSFLDVLGFRQSQQGANIWFVVPNDEGVFHNCGTVENVMCVDPVQAYLDLQAHPERGTEMAPLLRKQIDIARRIRAYDSLEKILDDYKSEGISREHINFVKKAISPSEKDPNPSLPNWNGEEQYK